MGEGWGTATASPTGSFGPGASMAGRTATESNAVVRAWSGQQSAQKRASAFDAGVLELVLFLCIGQVWPGAMP